MAIEGSYFDKEYVQWVWTELDTLEKWHQEAGKYWPEMKKVMSQLKKMTDTEKRNFITSQPNAEILQKAHDIEKVGAFWDFHIESLNSIKDSWQAFQPNCMKGQYAATRRKSSPFVGNEWRERNTITGKCDWPDWRSDKTLALHRQLVEQTEREVIANKDKVIFQEQYKLMQELKKLQEMKRTQTEN